VIRFTVADLAQALGTVRRVAARRASAWPTIREKRGAVYVNTYAFEDADPKARRALALLPQFAIAVPASASPPRRDRGDVAAAIARLTDEQRARYDAKTAIVEDFQTWRRSMGIGFNAARSIYADLYREGKRPTDPAIRLTQPPFSADTLRTWFRLVKRGDVETLACARKGKHRKGKGRIDTDHEVKATVLGMLTAHPHTSSANLMAALRTRFAEERDRVPPYATVCRWVKGWKAKNKQLFEAVRNPDAWRSKYRAAPGNAEAGIARPNQMWQLDSSPFDVMCSDGRHVIIGALDVATRRVKYHVARTSSANGIATLLRRCLLDWGVPESIKTDNGSDYTSRRIIDLTSALGIEHELCPPFSPEKKPFIERVFGTFQHGLVELLPGFAGHNVAEAQAIRARRTFAARQAGVANDSDLMTPAELQKFCDDICEVEMARPRRALGNRTPLQLAAGYQAKRIANERALDVLLLPAPQDGGRRRVGKKGIKVGGGIYAAGELGGLEGSNVFVRLDPEDIGRIFVFDADRNFICIAVDPATEGVSLSEIAAHQRARQARILKEQKAELREYRKSNVVTAQDILAHQLREARKVGSLPQASQTYDTPALDEAARASVAADRAAAPPVERLKRAANHDAELDTPEMDALLAKAGLPKNGSVVSPFIRPKLR
jgi:hypothetical protein